MGRAWIAPLGLAGSETLKNAWIGGSFWTANRTNSPANQVDRLPMRTQGGLTFFNPVAGPIHAGDQGQLLKWGVELNVPVSRFVFKGEVIGSSESIRETAAGADLRRATFSGVGAYVRASYFVFGDPLINGLAGMQLPPHPFGVLKPGKMEPALQLVVDYGHLSSTYGATSDGVDGTVDPLVGDTNVDAVQVGVNYWYTKHVRLTANFLYNFFSGSAVARVVPVSSTWEAGAPVALAL
jgi:phosphate-selective porin O/P